MKITVRIICVTRTDGAFVSLVPGREYDLPTRAATRLVDGGLADFVEQPPASPVPPAPEPELEVPVDAVDTLQPAPAAPRRRTRRTSS